MDVKHFQELCSGFGDTKTSVFPTQPSWDLEGWPKTPHLPSAFGDESACLSTGIAVSHPTLCSNGDRSTSPLLPHPSWGLLVVFATHMETQWPCPCCPTVPGPERGETTCGRTLPRVAGGHRTLPVPCPATACGYNLHHPRHAAGAIPMCWCCGLLQQPGECELGVWHMGGC